MDSTTKAPIEPISEVPALRSQPDEQSAAVSLALNEHVDGIRKLYSEKENETRIAHESRLHDLKQRLEQERQHFEQSQRQLMEQQWSEKRKEIEREYEFKKKIEQGKFSEQLEIFKNQQLVEMEAEEAKERHHAEKNLQHRIENIRFDMDKRYEAEMDSLGFSRQLEEKKRNMWLKMESETSQLQLEHQNELQALKNTYAESKQAEVKKLELQLFEIRTHWNDKIKVAEQELQSQEHHVRSQLSEQHQKQIHDREAEFKKQFDKVEHEWKDKINKLKNQLANEQSNLEEELIRARKESKDSARPFSASLSVRKQDLEQFTRENDMLFSQQKRRKEFLDNEKKMMDKFEQQLNERRAKLDSDLLSLETREKELAQKAEQKAKEAAQRKRHENEEDEPIDNLLQKSRHTDDFEDTEYTTGKTRRPKKKNVQDAVDPGALSSELERSLNREQRNIQSTKEYLMERQESIISRQKELEDSRQKWKSQLEMLNKNLTSNNNDLFLLRDIKESQENAKASEERLDSDLVGAIKDLKKSIENNQGVPRPSAEFTGGPVLPVRGSSYRPSHSMYALGGTAGGLTSHAPASASGVTLQIMQWEEEKKRSQDLLRRHSSWLHQFKQRIGVERPSIFTSNK